MGWYTWSAQCAARPKEQASARSQSRLQSAVLLKLPIAPPPNKTTSNRVGTLDGVVCAAYAWGTLPSGVKHGSEQRGGDRYAARASSVGDQ